MLNAVERFDMSEKNLSVQHVLVYKGENFNTTYTHFIYIKTGWAVHGNDPNSAQVYRSREKQQGLYLRYE
jgi:hypothetical protein